MGGEVSLTEFLNHGRRKPWQGLLAVLVPPFPHPFWAAGDSAWFVRETGHEDPCVLVAGQLMAPGWGQEAVFT